MNERHIPLTNETPKHKKKSKAKGLPRADHKHTYETVLLYINCKFFNGTPTQIVLPTKVCSICGRIGSTDTDPSYYILTKNSDLPYRTYTKDLSEKALSLPKWHANDFFDKFAAKGEPECV